MNSNIEKIDIFNVLGEKIKTFESIVSTNEFSINASGFSSGVYIVIVNNEISQKLIIE